MRRMLATAAVLAACSPTAQAMTRSERHAMHRCDQHHVRACIRRAAVHRGVSPSYMRAVAYCESRFNPWAVNRQSGAAGLYQFLGSTWAATPYARFDRLSAKWSSLAAARMFAAGQAGQWSCA